MSHKKTYFKKYLENLANVFRAGDAREESFYSTLADLIRGVAKATGHCGVIVTVLPRPTEAGNPDFRVWDGMSRIVGYLEAKSPTEELLDRVEGSAQLQRYQNTFPNFILTNFLEFRLYRYGRLVSVAKLGRPFVLTTLQQTPPLENADKVFALLDQFLGFSLPTPLTAQILAVELAKRTRFLRDIVQQQLTEEIASGNGYLLGFYEAFQKFLIGSLTKDEFADLYAQSITYGLFAARTRATNGFSRRVAFEYIPTTVGVLRELFRFISLGKLPEEMAWIIDDIAEVLAVADVGEMMTRYYHEGRGSDPVVHFYETFLAEYDPEERERRGVYYTPDPIVSYIVRSLHTLLRSHFGKNDGLASNEVTLLDPAAGTMTFVARAAELAVEEFTKKYGVGGREAFIRNHILGNFYAFELMMAPYAVGHLKMGFFLEELGHRLQDDERIPFYLTNSLDMKELEASKLPGLSSLAEESRLAGRVKKDQPILVILGNPPYSGHSANKGEWILRQIETYKQVDGKPLGEKNPKWLQDDYVKFLRFAQWKIEQAGRGVVGMITNHGYIDNPTFRGMRRSLMQTFNEIYLLDLHGNSLKRERSPDGNTDENVFDIRQGVAIALLIKTGERNSSSVYHADLWGVRKYKYEWLKEHDVKTTQWVKINPRPNFYLFVPHDKAGVERYDTFISVTDIFEKYSVGIVTGRDRLAIHWTADKVWATVLNFSRIDPEMARQAYGFGNKVSLKRIKQAQDDVKNPRKNNIVPVLYRPFDVRYTYYTGTANGFHERPRPEIMRHMLSGQNLALITSRLTKGESFRHAQVTCNIVEVICMSPKTSNNGFVFPLYLYPAIEQVDLFRAVEPMQRRPNLRKKVLTALAEAYGQSPTPEQILHYIYGVLYAPSYREKYADCLRLDFPRVPFPSDPELFWDLAALGEQLVAFHLLKSPVLDSPTCRFEGRGDNRVAKNRCQGFQYLTRDERVYINQTQYFEPVPLEVWEYAIGGYRVCEKWLKDRKGRQLTLNEIRTYCRIVTALEHTIRIQEEIDGVYLCVEKAPLLLNVKSG